MTTVNSSTMVNLDYEDKQLVIFNLSKYPVASNTPPPKLPEIALELSTENCWVWSHTFPKEVKNLCSHRSIQFF